ncbi:MAG: CoA-binding protein [Alphaproteobacteria bacterium]
MSQVLVSLLGRVKTIAIVGASPKPERASYQVMEYLLNLDYDVIPINPKPEINEILGCRVVNSLDQLSSPVDMVDVFRKSNALMGVARESVSLGAKVLWAQLGVIDHAAASYANRNGLSVVMDRCPKIELEK